MFQYLNEAEENVIYVDNNTITSESELVRTPQWQI